jgi:peptidyl-prolyl cis-trans isomerase A (cyclophilin A)
MKMTLNVMLASLASVLVLAGVARAQNEKPAQTPPASAQPASGQPGAAKPVESKPGQPAGGDGKKAEGAGGAVGKEEPKVSSESDLTYVRMSTNKGDIYIEVNGAKAPISAKNFLAYVDKGYYNGTIFHRVIPSFMIQGGGYTAETKDGAVSDVKEKPGLAAPIKNEWTNGLKNVRGAVAMARTADHNSATSQFFINVKDNKFLDEPRDGAGYAVFGRVVAGMSTVDKIKDVKTTKKGMMGDLPVEPVTITAAVRTTKDEADKAAAADK